MQKILGFLIATVLGLLFSADALTQALVFSGRVSPVPLAVIYAPADGELKINADGGSQVSEGQILGQINAPVLEEKVIQSRQELSLLEVEIEKLRDWQDSYEVKSAEHSFENAKLTKLSACHRFQGSQTLYEHGLISMDEFDSDERQCRLAERAQELSEAHLLATQKRGSDAQLLELEGRKEQLTQRFQTYQSLAESLIIYTDVPGKLISKTDSGTTLWQHNIPVSAGKALAIIADANHLQINIKADEFDVVSLKAGMSADIQLTAFPSVSIKGHIATIDDMPYDESDKIPTYLVTVILELDQLSTIDWRYGFSVTVAIEA